jgi:crossover junction endodeoxyribonuclease RuvC
MNLGSPPAGAVRIVGIDPGSHKAGWGIVDVVGGAIVHVDNGVLFLDDSRDLTVRLVDLTHRLRDVLTQYRPERAAVEDVFVQKGARSALILGQARGAALAVLGLSGLPVKSFSTSMVKQRVAGGGRAGKLQVAEMVRVHLGLKELPFEDAADALAVALCAALEETPGGRALQAAVALQGPVPAARRGGARAGLAALAKAQGKL